MTDHDRFEADGLALLDCAGNVDNAAAALSLAQTLLRERPAGPPASDFSVLGAAVAQEYRGFAAELTDLLRNAPGYVFDIADHLRATARVYESVDTDARAAFTRIPRAL